MFSFQILFTLKICQIKDVHFSMLLCVVVFFSFMIFRACYLQKEDQNLFRLYDRQVYKGVYVIDVNSYEFASGYREKTDIRAWAGTGR